MTPQALALVAALATLFVPDGRYVLVNGLLEKGEWDASASSLVDPQTEIRVHKDRRNVFLAIVFKGPRHTGVDLYVKSRGRTRMLHVSSALGERTFENGRWSDFTWGRNSWWTANAVGMVAEEGGRRILEPEAFEFQLDRREFGKSAQVYLHLKRPEKRLPTGASEEADDRWARLVLE